MEPSEQLLVDFACLDPIYVDGVAGLLNFGASFGVLYYRWVAVRSEGGRMIYEKAPALHVRQPRSSLVTGQSGLFAKLIDQAGSPLSPIGAGMH